MNRRVKDLFRALLGPPYSWGLQERARRTSVDLPARLQDTLDKISPEARRFEEQPVFIFSAGWRSGSTLLQRMIMEFNKNIIIWGEPFDHSNIHDNMVNQFRTLLHNGHQSASFYLRRRIGSFPTRGWRICTRMLTI